MIKKLKPYFPLLLITFIAAFIRFYNLNWGDGYFFHPDEINMARSVSQMCLKSDASHAIESVAFNKALNQGCSLNPHFFAYGQFPLYLAFFSDLIHQLLFSTIPASPAGGHHPCLAGRRAPSTIYYLLSTIQVSLPNAVFWLRFWSATVGTLTIPLIYLVTKQLLALENRNTTLYALLAATLVTFTPGLIQSSHFGTTESLLTFFFILILYLSLKILRKTSADRHSIYANIIILGIVSGIALGTKISAVYFLASPIISLFIVKIKSQVSSFQFLVSLLLFFIFTFSFFIFSSPYNLLKFQEFRRISTYEASIATGKAQVFYTRQFIDTIPILFQAQKIFPYALGWPLFSLGILGFLSITHMLFTNIKKNYVLRVTCYVLLIIAFLSYFIPNSLLYTKWTRFVTPIFPFFSIFTAYLFYKLQAASSKRFGHWNLIIGIFVTAVIIQGSLTATIYANPDVRFAASEWIYANVPDGSYILSETGNVVDIPLSRTLLSSSKGESFQGYKVISFDFYHIDENPKLQNKLLNHLVKADYILIPSRRIFVNHTRFPDKYPTTTAYYNALFSGTLGFEQVVECDFMGCKQENLSSPMGRNNLHPQIKRPYHVKIFDFVRGEAAEETWSVFDHPVIRIYKKIKQFDRNYYENILRKD